jgi:branched-chain amino acid transport system permease protein
MLLFGFAMVLIIAWKPRGFIGMREPTLVLKRRKPIDAELREEHG